MVSIKRSGMKIGCAALLALTVCACGSPNAAPQDLSTIKERYEIDTSDIPVQPSIDFVNHSRAIVDAGSGSFTINELVSLLPMQDDQRALLTAAFTTPFGVTCVSGLCTARGDGQAVEARIEASTGVIKNPLLGLQAHADLQFVKRGDAAVEFCNVTGVYLRKSFIRKTLQGMHVDVASGKPAVTAQLGNDSQNYTCQ